jgi:hypothetical protein
MNASEVLANHSTFRLGRPTSRDEALEGDHGVLASRHRWRRLVAPRGPSRAGEQVE